MLTAKFNAFLNRTLEARRIPEIGEALLKAAQHFRFTRMIIVDAAKVTERVAPAILFGSNAALTDVIAYDRRISLSAHPILKAGFATDRPFCADELRSALGIDDTTWQASLPTPKGRERNGIVVPVHRNGALQLFVTFAGPHPNDSPTARAFLHTCAHIAHDRLRALETTRRDRKDALSKREAACLHWAAQGKTASEIGQILSIAPRTVRFHLTNAKRKLSAASRFEAIAKRATALE